MRIEAFNATVHNRQGFDSGNPALNEYLQRHLAQNLKKGIIQAYVAVDRHNAILGYYTLSAAHILHEELPEAFAKKLPRYPVPAVLIGRMASSLTARNNGLRLGSKLLIHAMQQTLKASATLGIKCLVVDAKPEALGFYQHFGFLPLKQVDDLRLYLPIDTLKQL